MAALKFCGSCSLLLIGLSLAITFSIVLFNLNDIIQFHVQQKMIIDPDSEMYQSWVSSPVPIYFKMHLFNVTNPREIEVNGSTPHVEQVGPFVFEEKRRKKNIEFIENDTLVSYRDHKYYYFREDLSSASLTDSMITLPNIPVITAVYNIKEKSKGYFLSFILNSLLSAHKHIEGLMASGQEPLFITKTAEELLFKGYQSPLIKKLDSYVSPFLGELTPNSSFGLMYNRNGTWDPKLDGEFTIWTGANIVASDDDPNALRGNGRMSEVFSWNDKHKLSFWTDGPCNAINGTDGTHFPGPIRRGDTLYIFNTDLCRSLGLKYEKDVIFKGIPGLRFTVPREAFQAPQANSSNYCFCPNNDYDGNPLCQTDGVLDMSPCLGAPLVVSTPHFYQGDARLRQAVKGITDPVKELHETYLDIEPMTGVVMRGYRRVQLNIQLFNDPKLGAFEKLGFTVLPIAWIEESAELTDDLASQIKFQLVDTPIILRWVLYSCIAFGIAIISITVMFMVHRICLPEIRKYFGSKFGLEAAPMKFRDQHSMSFSRSPIVVNHSQPGTRIDKIRLPEMEPLQHRGNEKEEKDGHVKLIQMSLTESDEHQQF